ncbi:MAG: thiamine diphosphokinase [Anaerolineales bacterium]
MRAVIFANGVLSHPSQVHDLLRPGDYLIAADGGARHCLALGLRPHLALGDFDSLTPDLLGRLQSAGVPLRRYPPAKDETDLELALLAAREAGADQVLILGALGGRWDMTLGNILLLAHPDFWDLRISLVDGPQEIWPIPAGQPQEIRGLPGDTVSLIPLGGDAEGVTTRGLQYALSEGRLRFGAARGVSNVLLESPAQVFVRKGLVVCILIHR